MELAIHQSVDKFLPYSVIQENQAVLNYVNGFHKLGCNSLISNLWTRLNILAVDETLLPVTVNEEEYGNSYVCSPYTAFTSYALEELCHLHSPVLQYLLRHTITSLSGFLQKAQINRAAAVNNWMISTNLYQPWPWERLLEITDFLRQQFPHHYIIFRSLNSFANKAELAAFLKAGYRLLPTRQVYIYPIQDTKWRKRHNVEIDFKFLKKTSLHIVENEDIGEADYARIEELYRMLYIDKYSQHNPQYTAEFMKLCHQTGIMNFRGFRDTDGRLCTVMGSFTVNRIITAPIVGYDTKMSQKLGLYRLAITLIMQTALTKGLDLHLSAGAATFKRLRGGIPYIEYSAVYDRHLSQRRQITSAVLVFLTKLLFIPLMKILKL